MNTSAEHSVDEPIIARKANFLPPWLWLWLLLYLAGFFHSYTYFMNDIGIIFADTRNIAPEDVISRSMSIGEFIPLLALFAGVLMVFLPWIRACWLKLHYRIMRIEELAQAKNVPKRMRDVTLPGLLEMQVFVHRYAPEVSLTYAIGFADDSLADTRIQDQPPIQWLLFVLRKCHLWFTNNFIHPLNDRAITYATGYRRTASTVSSAQLALWKNDTAQAQEVLLHELAHHFHGDAMIVGAGSLLETVSRYWLWFAIIWTIAPFVIYDVIYYVTYSQGFDLISKILPDVPQRLAQPIFQDIISIDIPDLLVLLLLSLVWNITQFIMLIAAMWCAEFNADRFMRDNAGSIKMFELGVKGKKEQGAQKKKLRHLLFANITHPPQNASTQSASLSLSIVEQDPQGHIHGTMVIGAPFSEQGSFDGTITSARIIQITFTPDKKKQAAPIQFYGTVSANGTMLNGLYTIASAGQTGTWKVQ